MWKAQILGTGCDMETPKFWVPKHDMETPIFLGFGTFSIATWKPQISHPQATKNCHFEEEVKAGELECCLDLFVTREKL